jgi:ADP-ribose pyrophosphatase YjhB (NUDIX family)
MTWTPPLRIRPKAVCVCRRGDEVLVGEGYDRVKQQYFYGPPGGGIEFGERAVDAVQRELLEEIEAELDDVVLLGVVENIFAYEAEPGHEIVFVYEARLRDPALYEVSEIAGVENGADYRVRWMPLAHFREGTSPLYPDGLLELLGG